MAKNGKSGFQGNGYQTFIPGFGLTSDVVEAMSGNATAQERGAIFTRIEVVDFILDLVGYSESRPLHTMRLLEPSAGNGDFLLPAIKRLLRAWRANASTVDFPETDLLQAISAVELHTNTKDQTHGKIINLLIEEGLSAWQANELADNWLIQGDFLLSDTLERGFDFVVGNPPYVRQELIPDILINEYRLRYHTIYDRADLYIPFIEKSLLLLLENGHLGFICSDRWMKNKYGGPLRKFVSNNFHLKFHIDMVDTQAFQSDVIAYPAINIMRKGKGTKTRVAYRPEINGNNLSSLASLLMAEELPTDGLEIKEIEHITAGKEPWILDDADKFQVVRRLESDFPLIEEVGCKVGIGVATGADKSFIGLFDDLDVEADRKIPLIMTKDIDSGTISWSGNGIINPFYDDGTLVDLGKYPRLKSHLERHKDIIVKRHVATKNPVNWYRTIDRIYPTLTTKPKLLIPDIKGEANIVYDEGKYYPHHNLYFVTSDRWPLKVLQAVLKSGIARLFVSTYSTKMRGGYLRFQAQYLRRIRIPRWEGVPEEIKQILICAAAQDDLEESNRAIFKLYSLNEIEIAIITSGK